MRARYFTKAVVVCLAPSGVLRHLRLRCRRRRPVAYVAADGVACLRHGTCLENLLWRAGRTPTRCGFSIARIPIKGSPPTSGGCPDSARLAGPDRGASMSCPAASPREAAVAPACGSLLGRRKPSRPLLRKVAVRLPGVTGEFAGALPRKCLGAVPARRAGRWGASPTLGRGRVRVGRGGISAHCTAGRVGVGSVYRRGSCVASAPGAAPGRLGDRAALRMNPIPVNLLPIPGSLQSPFPGPK